MVFVAQVDVDGLDADRPGGDQRAFQETVRIALEVEAVLEGARLAFVDVNRHQARTGFVAHDAPLASGREAGAAQAAQARVFHGLDDRFDVSCAAHAVAQKLVAAAGAIRCVADEIGRHMDGFLGLDLGGDRLDGRERHRVLPDYRSRGLLAAADARRRDHAHVASEDGRQLGQQVPGAGHFARQAVAHTHRQRGRRLAAFLDHVEVVVESRDFIHFGLGQFHLGGQRGEVFGRQAAEAVLDLVQMLDQHIGLARLFAQQRLHLRQGSGIDAPAFWRLALALFGRALYGNRDNCVIHFCSQMPKGTTK